MSQGNLGNDFKKDLHSLICFLISEPLECTPSALSGFALCQWGQEIKINDQNYKPRVPWN